ncbi:UDP-2,4-diacetamido-2,4,6-trideoxy-beta-L-altropyranose hydrolase [Candidatus Magnetaquicoccus inordinatus]|uniref:UDP-2,4-diacetamido-2,4, 6-trideoxy-beta-L-altropyranose hydrolase n=1 Tax=Candidatus Magnetaquicoccus inordinatus TaxID=2496818 RepID=UPI00187D605C|nr:UDP-2,4-diacetamido-2,4,6-trideoxy-beta-L-altropyranose hydrolase [Candidatus Magnetaquicoccus inordinatus]
MAKLSSLCFRADASPQIGLGHVMRCLTLADTLAQQGIHSHFICAPEGAALAQEVLQRRHRLSLLPKQPRHSDEDAQLCRALLTDTPLWLIVDHYGLDRRWQQSMRALGCPIMAIDDLERPHDCDLLLDQNLLDNSNPYQALTPPSCRPLLGPHYALLRPEFANLRQQMRLRSQLQHVLLFFGGSDPGNETCKALQGLLQSSFSGSIEVIVGKAYAHREPLQRLVAQGGQRLSLQVHIDNIAERMHNADLAIGAGGTASWERCCLGLPTLITILADNQIAVAERLQQAGAACNLGFAAQLQPIDYTKALEEISPAQLLLLSGAAAQLVDGQGSMRVAAALLSFSV